MVDGLSGLRIVGVAAMLGLCLRMDGAIAGGCVLCENGKVQADIVLPENPGGVERFAAEELQYHLGKAFGTKPVVLGENRIGESVAQVHLYVGRTVAARGAGLLDRTFDDEERLLRTVGNAIHFVGGDRDTTYEEVLDPEAAKSCGTLFAVYDFLENELGVKWLWPGELGEVIPMRESLSVGEIDRSGRELLSTRYWYLLGEDPSYKEIVGFTKMSTRRKFFAAQKLFLIRHRICKRRSFLAEHSFREYWDKYGKTHPEYFNLLPNGRREPLRKGAEVTMCVSEPGLWRRIAEEWNAWYEKTRTQRNPPLPWVNCCENDSCGLCTCERCRAWDGPDPRFDQNGYWSGKLAEAFRKSDGTQALKEVGHAEFGTLSDTRWCVARVHPKDKITASLSDRYARYYNAVQAEARKTHPEARAFGYTYCNYQEPPLEAKLDPDVVLFVVPRSMFPYDREESEFFRRNWMGWRKAGGRDMILRPNYMLAGGNYPMDFARLALDDFAFAATNGMIGCTFDSLLGSCSAHAMAEYALTRTMREPTRGYARAREDMCSSFGKAAAAVGRYFDAVERHSMKWTYDQYSEISLANTMGAWTGGSFAVPATILGEFFTDEDFAGYHAILDEAVRAAQDDATTVVRIEFLRKGVRDAELTRKCRMAQKPYLADEENAAKKAAFLAAYDEMARYRASVEADFVCNYAHNSYWEKKFLKWPHELTKEDE